MSKFKMDSYSSSENQEAEILDLATDDGLMRFFNPNTGKLGSSTMCIPGA